MPSLLFHQKQKGRSSKTTPFLNLLFDGSNKNRKKQNILELL